MLQIGRCMETGGTGYRLHQSMSWNHILNKPVLRCIEIVLSCLEADRSKKLSIGDIVDKLNETMFPFGGNDPGSLISLLEKVRSQFPQHLFSVVLISFFSYEIKIKSTHIFRASIEATACLRSASLQSV